MKPALQEKQPKYPRGWQTLPMGEALKKITEERLSEVTNKMFGYHIVKVGDLSSQLELTNCPIKHRISQSNATLIGPGLLAESNALPFTENSIDAFILAHELDFAQDPHQILREIDRCIVPNGHVVICGFNPYSLMGLFKWLPIKRGNLLHDARMFSRGRIKDWLGLLGYQVTEEVRFVHASLFFEGKLNSESRWTRFASKYLSFFASMYLIVGKKREIPLSLIKPVWKPKPQFAPVSASLRILRDGKS